MTMANQRAIISFALPASCLLLGSSAGRRTYYGTYERGAERGGAGRKELLGKKSQHSSTRVGIAAGGGTIKEVVQPHKYRWA